jgi:glucan phosphoethanolaminetransferase (alkaline phosphatase superfamily)
LIWLATTIAFLAVAVLLWRRHPRALQLTIALLVVSLGLCIASLPGSIYGLVIDVATLAALAVMPEKFLARPARAG